MMREQRLEKIVELVNKKGTVSLKEIQSIFNVSMVTIRRDVAELVRRNLLQKVHGGVKPTIYYDRETDFMKRLEINRSLKEKIAERALEFVNDGDTLFLDASTTVYMFAKKLSKVKKNLYIITNGVMTAMEISKNRTNTVILINGVFHPETLSLVGPLAVDCARKFFTQKAFISCRGFSPESGTYEINTAESELKKVMVENTETLFVLIDSSKIGKKSLVNLVPLNKINYVITDKISKKDLNSLMKNGINVITV